MSDENIPERPPKSTRITLELFQREERMDNILLKAIREQNENEKLKNISRVAFKKLFKDGKILIKGQRATPSSSLAKGITYVDILGFSEKL